MSLHFWNFRCIIRLGVLVVGFCSLEAKKELVWLNLFDVMCRHYIIVVHQAVRKVGQEVSLVMVQLP